MRSTGTPRAQNSLVDFFYLVNYIQIVRSLTLLLGASLWVFYVLVGSTPIYAAETKKTTSNSCADLISSDPLTMDNSILQNENPRMLRPGLMILDSNKSGTADLAHPSEMQIGTLYAQDLVLRGETLLLVPKYKQRQIPGFDGIIFDEKKKATFNLSIKSLTTGSLQRAITLACRQAVKASLQELSWDGSFSPLIPEVQTWRFNALELFGVRFGHHARRTRIVVARLKQMEKAFDLKSLSKTIEKIRDRISLSHHLIESISLISQREIIEVSEEKV